MPIPKAVEGRWSQQELAWIELDKAGHLKHLYPFIPAPAFESPRLLRFIDFDPPQGRLIYRVRLKYRIPGITPETVFSTAWSDSTTMADINTDQFLKPQEPQMPVIELKPPTPADPASKPSIKSNRFKRGPANASSSEKP